MSVFTRIADVSRTIEAGYPVAAAALARDTSLLQEVRHDPELQEHLTAVQHGYRSNRDLCDGYRRTLAELGDLVFRHLPDLAGEIRIVSDTVGHFQGELDVDQLIRELRRIRAAAAGRVAAEDQGQPVEDRGGSYGSVTIPPELRPLLDQLPPDDTAGLRPAYRRDHLFRLWNEQEGGFGPARIFKRWNELSNATRRVIAPKASMKVTQAGAKNGLTLAKQEHRERRQAGQKTHSRRRS